VLPYNSAINAAITSWGGTYVTGRKAVGSDQNMFLYQYDTENGSGNVVYRDAIENRSAAGNAIAAGSTGFNPDGYFLLRVAGYRDTRSGLAVPHDYEMFSRHYFRFIIGFAKKTVTDDEAMAGKLNAGNTRSVMFQNVPNPFIQSTVINYDLLPGIAKANIVVYNAAGNIVRTFALNGKGTGSVTLNANGLTPGNYYYELIIDGKKTDSKQMVLIK
jgi:hypothetical protein